MSTLDENFFSLGPRLAEERQRIGLSQAKLGELCGVSREMIGKYEKGKGVPGGEVLFLLSKAGADVSYILTGARTQPPPALVEPPGEKVVRKRASVREEALADYAAEDPLSRRKAQAKALIDQIDDPRMLDAVQADIEEIQRVKGLERRVAELERKAG